MPLSKGSSQETISKNVREMVHSGHSQETAIAAAMRVAREKKAPGGSVKIKPKVPDVLHTGPIQSHVAGRTDHLNMHVPSGSYVIPADIISSMGEGNTLAGFKIAKNIFEMPDLSAAPYGASGLPYSAPHKAEGGSVSAVPIVAAGGEYVVKPESVAHLGKGNLDAGHKILDHFVNSYRAKTVKTLKALPGPRRD